MNFRRILVAAVLSLAVVGAGMGVASAAPEGGVLVCPDPDQALLCFFSEQNTALQGKVSTLTVERDSLATQLEQERAKNAALASQVQTLTVQRDAALTQRDAAKALADARLLRIVALRAKVKELRQILRDVC